MHKVITWHRSDGGLSVTIPAYKDSARDPKQTDDELLALCVSQLPPGTVHHIVDSDIVGAFPSSRIFRNAWECPAGVVTVNMPKARVIHMNRIRVVRNAELVKLDTAFTRAVESGAMVEQARIAEQKRKLRDIPQTFDLSVFGSPESLAASWPAELPIKP